MESEDWGIVKRDAEGFLILRDPGNAILAHSDKRDGQERQSRSQGPQFDRAHMALAEVMKDGGVWTHPVDWVLRHTP